MSRNAAETFSIAPPPAAREVTSPDGTKIVYDLYEGGSDRTAIVVPGFWRSCAHPSVGVVARSILTSGCNVVVVDNRGHGRSSGVFGFSSREHEDVAAVSRDVVSTTATRSLALVGFSAGGAISISTAARHPDLPIASLLLVSPVADFATLVPRINPLTIHRHIALRQALRRPKFMPIWSRSERIRAVDDIGGVRVPVCFIHASNDWLVHHRNSERLFAAANVPKELHLLHLSDGFHADRIFGVAAGIIEPIARDFLRRTLMAQT